MGHLAGFHEHHLLPHDVVPTTLAMDEETVSLIVAFVSLDLVENFASTASRHLVLELVLELVLASMASAFVILGTPETIAQHSFLALVVALMVSASLGAVCVSPVGTDLIAVQQLMHLASVSRVQDFVSQIRMAHSHFPVF